MRVAVSVAARRMLVCLLFNANKLAVNYFAGGKVGGKVEDYRAAGERKRQTRRCIGGGDGGGGGGESERSGLSDWQGFKPITSL